MKLLVEPTGSRLRLGRLAGAIALVSFALFALTARAQASETLYWDNYDTVPPTVAFANLDGSGGGALSAQVIGAPGTEVEMKSPEGIAYDPANGRIYLADVGKEKIFWFDTDGSGAGVLDTGAAPVESPNGIAVDPATQIVYWANNEGDGSIGYAAAAGGAGGSLNTAGASIESPDKLALDTEHGRVYWIGDRVISYANLDGTGGGDLAVPTVEEEPEDWSGINFDPATDRLYILGSPKAGGEGIYWVSTIGLGGGMIELEEPTYHGAYGLAFDPVKGRFYWGNYLAGGEREKAFGTTTLDGEATVIGIQTAPVGGAQDPLVVKSPVALAAPTVTASGAHLSCSQGRWEPDSPGSYVYAAPLTYAYQWSKDGAAIAGATGSSYAATASGSYSCTVTATNRSGTASQASAAAAVTVEPAKPAPTLTPTPASVKLNPGSKKAVKVTAGKAATVKVGLANGGGTATGALKVCGTLTKQAKKGLVAPKCVAVRSIPAGGSAVAKLKVKTLGTARGTYKVTVLVKGLDAKPITAKVKVVAPKAKKH